MGGILGALKVMSGAKSSSVSMNLNKIYAFYSERSSGVTTVVLNVAKVLGEDLNKKVLIIDTNIMFPMSDYYLINPSEGYKGKDLLYITDTDEKREIISNTKYKNVSLLNIQDNSLVTAVSSRDSAYIIEYIFDKFIADFDYILVDVDKHFTNIALKSLTLADVIIQVMEDSAPAYANLAKVHAFFESFGLNTQKSSFIVLNKRLFGRNLDTSELDKLGYTIIGTIPYWEGMVTLSLESKLCMKDAFVVPKHIAKGFNDIISFVTGGSL